MIWKIEFKDKQSKRWFEKVFCKKNNLDIRLIHDHQLNDNSFGQYEADAILTSAKELQNGIIKKIDNEGYLPVGSTAQSYFEDKTRNDVIDAESLSESWIIGKAVMQKASKETLEQIAKDFKYDSVNDISQILMSYQYFHSLNMLLHIPDNKNNHIHYMFHLKNVLGYILVDYQIHTCPKSMQIFYYLHY